MMVVGGGARISCARKWAPLSPRERTKSRVRAEDVVPRE